MTDMFKLSRRVPLAAAFGIVLAGAACAPGTGETTKELGVAAIQDFVTNPLANGAPLAGVVLSSADLSKDAGRRFYEAEAIRVQLLANEAQGRNPTLQARYEAEQALYSAAATCIATGNCDELNEEQRKIKNKALLAEAAKGGSHSD